MSKVNKYNKFIFLSCILLVQGCFIYGKKEMLTLNSVVKNKVVLNSKLNSVNVSNNQITINGTGFSKVTSIKIKGSSIDQTLTIDSKSDSQIIAVATNTLSLLVGNAFDLIIGTVDAQATYSVTFTLQNGAIQANHLSSMGASSGQVLKYNGTSWVPVSQIDAQAYMGTWDATTTIPDVTVSSAGDYYIVSVAGGGYAVGDWIISDGYDWTKVAYSKTSVSSFNGRKGVVTLTAADYLGLKDGTTHKITGSSLNDIANVDLTGAATGNFLKFDGTNWIPASAVGGGSIGAADIAAGVIDDSHISATAAIAQSKIANLTTDLTAKQNTSSLATDVKAVTLTGLTSNTGSVAATDTIFGAFRKLMNVSGDYVSASAGASIVTGTIAVSGTGMITVPLASGTTSTEVANVTYVGNAIAANGVWTKNANGVDIGYTAGKVGIGTTAPSNLLHVVDTAGQMLAFFESKYNGGSGSYISLRHSRSGNSLNVNDYVGGFYMQGLGSDNTTWSDYSNILTQATSVTTGSEAGNLLFLTRINGTRAERMRIDSTGNIGIGTITPADNLHIGTSTTRAVLQVGSYGSLGTIWSSGTAVFGSNVKPAASGTNGMEIISTHGSFGGQAIEMTGTKGIAFHTMSGAVTAGTAYTSEKARFDTSGNLGIGTMNPGASAVKSFNKVVDLVSTTDNDILGYCIRNNEGTNNRRVGFFLDDSTGTYGLDSTASTGVAEFVLQVAGSEKLRLTNAGNVGIGTSAPVSTLDVESTSATASSQVTSTGYGTGFRGNFLMRAARGNKTTPTAILTGDILGTLGWAAHNGSAFSGSRASIRATATEDWSTTANGISLGLYTTPNLATASVERVHIEQDGSVGIGTTAPAHALDVYGDCIAWMGTCINASAPSNAISYVASTLKFSSNTTQAISLTRWLGAHGTAPATGDIDGILVTRAGVLSNIYVKADANTNDAATTFTIYKNTVSTGVAVSLGASTTTASDTSSSIVVAAGDRISVRVVTAGTAGTLTRAMLSLDHMVTTNVFSSQWTTSGSDISYSTGNVGIGTTAPAYKLDVNGTLNVSGATTNVSDLRFKKDIQKIPDALEKISTIDGVTYKFRNEEFPDRDFSHRREMGVIAQTVEKVFPEAISKDQKGYRSVAYTMLIAPVIEAIKEISGQLKALIARVLSLENKDKEKDRAIATKADKAEVDKLKAENKEIKAKLEKIEKLLEKNN